MQAWITGLIVAVAVAFVGVRVWRGWCDKPSCTCGLEEEDCRLGCNGCERLRTLAAFTEGDKPSPSAKERKS